MNGVDGVVLVMIQITDDPSAERTAPPRSTHMQPGDVSHALIQQGERERLGKTIPAAARRRGGGSSGDPGRASPKLRDDMTEVEYGGRGHRTQLRNDP